MTIALGIVGCGDVAFRTYFPGLAPVIADGSAVVAVCFDPIEERAKRAAALFPGAVAVTSLDALLQHPGLNAAVNLTPAPLHCEVTTALLNAGLHVFSEKPLAGSRRRRAGVDRAREAEGQAALLRAGGDGDEPDALAEARSSKPARSASPPSRSRRWRTWAPRAGGSTPATRPSSTPPASAR